MKNIFKVLGIISLALVIGFGMAACKHDSDGDGDGGGGASGGGSSATLNAEFDATVSDSALIGTWKGEGDNGTLVITAKKIGTDDELSNAEDLVSTISLMQSMYKISGGGAVTVKDGKVNMKVAGTDIEVKTYTITGSTLKMGDFEGTKQ